MTGAVAGIDPHQASPCGDGVVVGWSPAREVDPHGLECTPCSPQLVGEVVGEVRVDVVDDVGVPDARVGQRGEWRVGSRAPGRRVPTITGSRRVRAAISSTRAATSARSPTRMGLGVNRRLASTTCSLAMRVWARWGRRASYSTQQVAWS